MSRDQISDDKTKPFKLTYNPALTGIRAFLLVFVVLDHAFFGWKSNDPFRGSWDMISLFFVLSGFLITSLLLEYFDEHQRLSAKKFYSDRAFRLLPSVFLVCLGLTIYGLLVSVPDAKQRLWDEVLATLFYFQDFRYALRDVGFFGFLSQTWSLSIEEQFYFIWFILLLVLLKIGGKKAAFLGSILGMLFSFILRTILYLHVETHWQGQASYPAIYYPFYTRMDAVFMGCALAVALSINPSILKISKYKKLLDISFFLSVGAMLYLLVTTDVPDKVTYAWGMDLSEVASFLIVLYLISRSNSKISKFLSWSGFVLVGNLSYTVYILHWPIDVAISPGVGSFGDFYQIKRLIITFSLGLASWYLIEKPIAKWRKSKRIANINKLKQAEKVGVAE